MGDFLQILKALLYFLQQDPELFKKSIGIFDFLCSTHSIWEILLKCWGYTIY